MMATVNPMPGPTTTDPTAVVGRRFLAAVIDLGLLYGFQTIFWLLVSKQAPASTLRFSDALGENVCTGRGLCTNLNDRYVSGGPMLVLILISLAYLIGVFVIQRGLTGRTLGTMAVGLITVGEDGTPLGAGRALLRSIAGIVDYIPCCLPLVGIITVLAAPRHRRVGDMAASSCVVDAEWFGRPIPFDTTPPTTAPPAPYGGYPSQPPTPPSPQPPSTPTTWGVAPPPTDTTTTPWGTPTPAAPTGPFAPPGEPSAPPSPVPTTPAAPVPPTASAGPSTTAPASGTPDQPVWDADRQAYIQWDPQRQQWLQFDQTSGKWHQYDTVSGQWRPVPD